VNGGTEADVSEKSDFYKLGPSPVSLLSSGSAASDGNFEASSTT